MLIESRTVHLTLSLPPASLLCLVPGALLAVELLWTEEELSALENS